MLKTIGENIIFKIQTKLVTKSGIVLPGNQNQTVDKRYIDRAWIYQIGEKIDNVKEGQEVILSGRPMLPIDIEKYIGEEKDENVMYSKGKLEDIIAVIE